ncbi:MAG: alkaline phosphatase D [Lentimonas sp.]|jgi:alkaline phosphatase D
MRNIRPLILLVSALASSLISVAYHPTDFDARLDVIAFGSCNRQFLPQPLWPVIAENQPDLWIWGGDAIYGDSKDAAVIEAKYQQQLDQPNYAAFRKQFPIIGTWDDHDYGWNDAYSSYPIKTITQGLALDFTDVPADDPRRQHEGIYGDYDFGPEGKRVKVILIDNRYFSTKRKAEQPDLLGETQRAWLADTLRTSTAQINLLVSGTQIISEEHNYQRWGHFPDRAWLLKLIRDESIPGVICMSGDRHMHEISVLKEKDAPYPLVDITSSGLTHSWENFKGEPNKHRVGEVYKGLGFGILQIDWDSQPVTVTAEIHGRTNETVNTQRIELR